MFKFLFFSKMKNNKNTGTKAENEQLIFAGTK